VIVPAKNAKDTIEPCLQAILAQQGVDGRFEVILVDDGSTDDTAKLAEQPGVSVFRQKNAGPAAARNAGAQIAKGEILAFTDADCEPASDWLLNLTAPFLDSEVVGVKGVYKTRQKSVVSRFVQQEYESKYEGLLKKESIDFIDTYSAAYRKEIFIENGGFNTVFPVPSVEDQEFSFRLARKGYRMVFAPKAVVYHQHDVNCQEYAKRKFNIGYWKAFMLRWVPEKAWGDAHTPKSLLWQIGLLALAGITFILGWIWQPFFWLCLVSILFFFLTGIRLFAQVWQRDRGISWLVPFMLMLRALTLGSGLAVGFVHPPQENQKTSQGFSLWQALIKRLLDICVSFPCLILSLPVLLVAAVAIKLDSPGPVFFVQQRAGRYGSPFRMVKMRTMVIDAEKRLAEVMGDNILKGPVFKIPNDPRVTRVGQFLRKSSIDELPQFWNVLIGEMSLVGPRPEELWVVAQYNNQQRGRLAIKPGLTGPMQIAGRGTLDMDDRLALDLEYIQNYSFWRDVKILFKTIPAVLSAKGAI
jgi:lipopolysaccharide/colanic/teichoic acid biosynthesis glycosyltransferase/glycosyltransferase involved in cell wall biosynthesis